MGWLVLAVLYPGWALVSLAALPLDIARDGLKAAIRAVRRWRGRGRP